jgi:dihydroorotase
MKTLVLKNYRIVDETSDFLGTVVVEDDIIKDVVETGIDEHPGCILMPAFVDLHAHFREPGFPEKETIATASEAAAAGGYGTVVCMANTRPATDTLEKAAAIKAKACVLGLIDLYPAISLTKNMEGKELSEIIALSSVAPNLRESIIRMASEDGKDIDDDGIFLAALECARDAGIPVSCHCDKDGENAATARALSVAKKAGAHIHIAHASTAEVINLIREEKSNLSNNSPYPLTPNHYSLTVEVTPHHIALTEKDAAALGADAFGKVAPPLRSEADRSALIVGIIDGTVDAIATDHAPHAEADKLSGSPGFSGLETAFAACHTALAGKVGLSALSRLMSASPARILGLADRGRIAPGLRADLCIADLNLKWQVEPDKLKSKGKNSPFIKTALLSRGNFLSGKIVATMRGGRMVYDGR